MCRLGQKAILISFKLGVGTGVFQTRVKFNVRFVPRCPGGVVFKYLKPLSSSVAQRCDLPADSRLRKG